MIQLYKYPTARPGLAAAEDAQSNAPE